VLDKAKGVLIGIDQEGSEQPKAARTSKAAKRIGRKKIRKEG
jgi:hypothetical protein